MDIFPEGGGGEAEDIVSVSIRRLWPYGDETLTGDYNLRSALICVTTSTGTLDVERLDGVQYKYPLESYKRFRCPQAAPILIRKGQKLKRPLEADPREHAHVHLQFDDNEKVVNLHTKLREKSTVLPFISDIETAKKRQVPESGYQRSQQPELNLFLTFQSIEERDAFVRKLKHAKARWQANLKAEEEAEDLRTKRKVVEQYRSLLDKIQDEHQKRLQTAAHAQSGQLNAARENALECDVGLRLLYEDLVLKRKVLSPDEFWRRHMESLAGTIPLPQPSEDFFFPPSSHGAHVKRAADQVSSLLVESKLVQTKYDELVNGGKLTEEEFWSRLFQSRFYATLVGSSGTVTMTKHEPYFDDAKVEDPIDDQLKSVMDPRTSVNTLMPATTNLAGEDHLQKPGFGTKGVTDLVTPTTASDQLGAAKRHPLTLMERFNRHASRALQNRHDYSVFYSGGSFGDDTADPVVDLATHVPSSKETLGLLAALVTLESSLDRRPDVSKTNIIDTLYQQKQRQVVDAVRMQDLKSENQSKQPTEGAKEGIRCGRRLMALPVESFSYLEYGKMMNEELKNYKQDINPMSNELTATVAFVKCTSALRGSSEIGNEKLIREATGMKSLVQLFDSVADLQNKVKEILYHAYNPPPEGRTIESRKKLRRALEDLKGELHGLKRLEIDTTGHRKLTGIINTRTLTQPIVNAMDAALALPELRNI